ncbi:Repeat domain-containing protein [Faunimonas pinastri]|uniref:Repeat domain-containing protein n=1 Tax=Faunimonas pinastri TaxID=1855383 RepID=A0A1H9A5V3_9HYPH|nr:CRTAC1 family protein [Faunimonas pinastri]SEP71863.1 Repeat domain-containing protein [Faunimonas pinastri]
MSRFLSLMLAAFIAIAPLGIARADDAPPVPTSDIPDMHEEAKAAGIDQTYDGPWEFFVGGGVAALDCNGDGKPDLFIAGGKNPAKLLINTSTVGGPLSFKEKVLDLPAQDLVNVTGAYALDIDGDGHLDLAVLRVGRNLLLKGGKDCSFEVANRAWNFDGGRAWTTSFAATWEKGNRFPTLAFGNYVDRSAPGSPWGTCSDNDLFRPQAASTPASAAGGAAPASAPPAVPDSASDKPDYGERTVLTPGYCALSMIFTDWDHSGEPALRIANDRQYYRGGEEQMWKVSPGQPPRLYTTADGWQKVMIWGMGIAEADLDADGYPEYAITSMGDTKLQTLDKDAEEDRPVYRDEAWEKHATAHRPYTGGDYRPSTGWHSEFGDVNNDSLLDLFIAKGNVEEMPDFASYDPDNLLLGQWDGTFAESGDKAGIALHTKGRGGALVDLNLDGNLDLVVVNRGQPVSVFRNLGARTDWGHKPLGNWMEVKLREKGGNPDAVGARIAVKIGTRTLVRTVQVGGGHASGHAGFVHVGLGTAERAEVRVQWPDGEWSHPYRVFYDQFVTIERGTPQAGYWYPDDDGESAAATPPEKAALATRPAAPTQSAAK